MTTDALRERERTVRAALVAIYVVFAIHGLAMSSWVSRLPALRDHLHLSPQSLGLVLLSPALGSLVGPQLAGRLVARIGSGAVVAVMGVVQAVTMSLVGLSSTVGLGLLITSLLVMGVAIGMWDVAMNVEGATVEHQVGRSVMPRLHGAWSVGALTGALIASGASAIGAPLVVHLSAVGVFVAAVVLSTSRSFLAVEPGADKEAAAGRARDGSAWREPRTVLLGLLVLVMGFSEGAGGDWLGITAVDAYGASTTVGSLTFALFVAAATCTRFAGPVAIDRFGRVATLRAGALVAMAGVGIVVLSSALPLLFLGTVAWGAGIALGFPLGMSAASDDPPRAAARVSVVASIAYTSFLLGPPFIGWLAARLGGSVQQALTAVAVLLVAGTYAAGATAPLATAIRPQLRQSRRVSRSAGTGPPG